MGGAALTQLLTEMRDAQRRTTEVLDQLKQQDTLATVNIEKILAGFPAGDFEGHRRYHESVIEWRELRNRIVRECLVKAGQAAFFGGVGWVALAAWKAFILTVKQ